MKRQSESDRGQDAAHGGELERELERRLTQIETVEAADPVHAGMSGASLALFLGLAAVIAVGSWIGGAL